MSLPWIQVTRETWASARHLAVLAGVDFEKAFTAICNLYAWGTTLGSKDAPPTGICESPEAAKLLAAELNWKRDPAALVEHLVEVGLLEELPHGLRVRGTDRYATAWKKNRRRNGAELLEPGGNRAVAGRLPGGLPPVTGRKPGGNRGEPARKTETDTKLLGAPVAPLRNSPPISEPPPPVFDEKLVEAVDEFWDVIQGYRRDLGIAREKARPPGLNEWFAERLAEGVTGPELADAHLLYLRDLDFRAKDWPMSVFMHEQVYPGRLRDGRSAARATRDRLTGVALDG